MLEKIVLKPTRGDNILDLCFTSHPGIIHQCKMVPGFSDHHAVLVKILCNPPTILISQKSKCTVIIEQTGFPSVKK